MMLAALWTKLSGYLAAAGVVLGIVVGAFLYGRSDGKSNAEAAQAKANASARKQSKEVEDEINRLDDGRVRDALSKWMRDNGR